MQGDGVRNGETGDDAMNKKQITFPQRWWHIKSLLNGINGTASIHGIKEEHKNPMGTQANAPQTPNQTERKRAGHHFHGSQVILPFIAAFLSLSHSFVWCRTHFFPASFEFFLSLLPSSLAYLCNLRWQPLCAERIRATWPSQKTSTTMPLNYRIIILK